MTIQEINPEVQARADKLLQEFQLLVEEISKTDPRTPAERQDMQFCFLLLQIAGLEKRIDEMGKNSHKPLGLKRKDLLVEPALYRNSKGDIIYRVVCSDNSLPKTLYEGTWSQCVEWVNFNCVD